MKFTCVSYLQRAVVMGRRTLTDDASHNLPDDDQAHMSSEIREQMSKARKVFTGERGMYTIEVHASPKDRHIDYPEHV